VIVVRVRCSTVIELESFIVGRLNEVKIYFYVVDGDQNIYFLKIMKHFLA